MKKIFGVSMLIVLSISEVYSKRKQKYLCPAKSTDDGADLDARDVEARFAKLHKDNNVLTVTHIHHRKDDKNEEYDYTIKLCGLNYTGAVIQIDKKKGKKDKVLIAGRIDGFSLLVGGEDWLFVQYLHGKSYNKAHHCNGKQRQSWLSIRCEDHGEKPQLKVVEEFRYKTGNLHEDTVCYYLFEYNHPAACSHRKKLSGGAIFCIVVVSLAAAYLLFGFLYQRFIVGAKGFEQIPNFKIWKQVGNTAADGCDFVCRREEHPNTYKGMADALDIDSSDDDKDDGLLPM